jgi:hypothetical protein
VTVVRAARVARPGESLRNREFPFATVKINPRPLEELSGVA